METLSRPTGAAKREDLFFRFRSVWLSWAGIPFVFWPSSWAPWPAARVAGGCLLIAAGAAIRLLAVRSIGKRARVHRLSAQVLHSSGIYGVVRNPIYVGGILIAAGMCVVLGLFWYLPILTVYLAAIYHLVVLREERFLSDSFGEEFAGYARRVPRWIPRRFTAGIRPESPVPWGEVLRRERGYLAGLLLIVGLCLAKNQWYETVVGAYHRFVSGSRAASLGLLAIIAMVVIPLVMILRISQERARKTARRYREMLEEAQGGGDPGGGDS
ncbi:MAG: isoprenylcysteine carboxylmethyltransferase family protein [Planctomycetes bacterium]|nr:isoprenylcysteine carboxylmethyltransferase family protein [Planctomycetota bacterium]